MLKHLGACLAFLVCTVALAHAETTVFPYASPGYRYAIYATADSIPPVPEPPKSSTSDSVRKISRSRARHSA